MMGKAMKKRYKIIGLCSLLIMFILVVYMLNITGTESSNMQNEDLKNDTVALYEGFLEGKVCALNKNNREYLIEDLLKEKSGMYTYCDIDNDGKKELHLKAEYKFYSLKVMDDVLTIIFEGNIYNNPVNENGWCGISYYRHCSELKLQEYGFTTFNRSGEITEEVEYYWTDKNGNGLMSEADTYCFNGIKIRRKEWKKKTQKYDWSNNVPVIWKDWNTLYKAERNNDDAEIEINDIRLKTAKVKLGGNVAQVDIEYPYLDDYTNEVAGRINEQIYCTIITEDVFQYKENCEDLRISYEVGYVEDEMLSILFRGEKNTEYACENFEKALNFDIHDGKLLTISDLYEQAEIRRLLSNAIDSNELIVKDTFGEEEKTDKLLKDYFIGLFDNDSYIRRTDNFYIKENKMYFIVESVGETRQNVHIEWNIGVGGE